MEKRTIPTLSKRTLPPIASGVTVAPNEHVVQPIDAPEEMEDSMSKFVIVAVFVVLVILGVGTGFLLSRSSIGIASSKNVNTTTEKTGTAINTKNSVGVTDTKTFKDQAIGVIAKGGLSGEGTHQLTRDGGPSQTVYLISSIVDLDQYVGKKVTIWGQTMAAKKVAWLMDVGKLEVQ